MSLLCAFAAVFALLAGARPSHSGDPGLLGYAITELPGFGGQSNAVAVWTDEPNNLFLAAGSAVTAGGETHAVLWQNGTPTDLGTLGGDLSSATGLTKDAGGITVVGLSRNAGGQIHAFIWRGGTMTQLPTLGGSQSTALGINSSGVIYGYSDLSPSGRHACYWSGANPQITDLSTTPLQISKAWGSFNGGYVGYTSSPTFISHAAYWQSGVMTELGTLGGTQSVAYAGNADFTPSSPAIVGESQYGAGADYHAFLWQNGTMQDLGTLGGVASTAYAVSATTQVVGKARTAANAQRAAIWENGPAVDLTTQILNNSGWILTDARAIDNRGYIVGTGVISSATHAYMLRPVFPTGPAPVLDTVNPNTAAQGQTRTIVLGGHGFVQGATLNFGPGVTVNSAVVSAPGGGDLGILSDHILTVGLSVAADAPTGTRDVTVTNPDQQSVTKSSAFTVTAGTVTPALASFTLTPATVQGGAKLSGSVTLTAPAPNPKGAKVTFASNNSSVKAPKAVTVKKGQTMLVKPFVYKTKKVRSQITATITATYGGISQPVTITLTP